MKAPIKLYHLSLHTFQLQYYQTIPLKLASNSSHVWVALPLSSLRCEASRSPISGRSRPIQLSPNVVSEGSNQLEAA